MTMMIYEPIDRLWHKLKTLFETLVPLIISVDNGSVSYNIGKNNNESFPLRAYLSFMKSSSGEELAITIDVKKIDDQFFIESDICNQDGTIISEGPSTLLELMIDYEKSDASLNKWFEEFKAFLAKNHETLKAEILKLK